MAAPDAAERMMQRLELLIDCIEMHLSDTILADRILRNAIYKEFREAADAMADTCAMAGRTLSSSATDDYSNIDVPVIGVSWIRSWEEA
ncbi:MAG: hypothetical protein KO206_04450 [Methanomicrobiaceae archaeon]|nr:hypothetical protein [Methanomicrobiaceae archaeon]